MRSETKFLGIHFLGLSAGLLLFISCEKEQITSSSEPIIYRELVTDSILHHPNSISRSCAQYQLLQNDTSLINICIDYQGGGCNSVAYVDNYYARLFSYGSFEFASTPYSPCSGLPLAANESISASQEWTTEVSFYIYSCQSAIACSSVSGGYFLAARFLSEGGWHYGWLNIDASYRELGQYPTISYLEVDVKEFAYHALSDKSILAGQTR